MAKKKVHGCVEFETCPYDHYYAKVPHQSDCVNGQEHQKKGFQEAWVSEKPKRMNIVTELWLPSLRTMDLDLKDKNKEELNLGNETWEGGVKEAQDCST